MYVFVCVCVCMYRCVCMHGHIHRQNVLFLLNMLKSFAGIFFGLPTLLRGRRVEIKYFYLGLLI